MSNLNYTAQQGTHGGDQGTYGDRSAWRPVVTLDAILSTTGNSMNVHPAQSEVVLCTGDQGIVRDDRMHMNM